MSDDGKQPGKEGKTPTVFYLTGRPPLFLSFWILTIAAWAGFYWLFSSLLGHNVASVLMSSLINVVTAMILKDSMLREPPYKM